MASGKNKTATPISGVAACCYVYWDAERCSS
jgi:hypothetical protein